jgi:hypothetical protein
LVGVAVNKTKSPKQIGFLLATILTDTGKFGFTTITTELLVAGFPVGQTALDVKTQVMISPFAKAVLL